MKSVAKKGAKFGLAHKGEIMHLGEEALKAAGHTQEEVENATEEELEDAAESFWSSLKNAAKNSAEFAFNHGKELVHIH